MVEGRDEGQGEAVAVQTNEWALIPPIYWPPRACDLTLAGIEEVLRIVREASRWVLRSACEEVCITDADIRKVKAIQKRNDLIAAKITAYEWFFEPYKGLAPRLSLEEVCRVLHRDPKYVRDRVRANPASKATHYEMPPGYRAELLSEERGAQAWKLKSEVAAEAAAAAAAAASAEVAVPVAAAPVEPVEPAAPVLPAACLKRAKALQAEILDDTARNTFLATATTSARMQNLLDALAAVQGSVALSLAHAPGPVKVTFPVTE